VNKNKHLHLANELHSQNKAPREFMSVFKGLAAISFINMAAPILAQKTVAVKAVQHYKFVMKKVLCSKG
jgi:hypothetical protein